jgi:hypothetical protein
MLTLSLYPDAASGARGDALMSLDVTRQRFLAAWRHAVLHLPADIIALEIAGTTTAMRALAALEGRLDDLG